MKKPTSNDVAARAGVSQSTVSLILNGSNKVFFSNETKERVIAAAQELGYQLPKHRNKKSRRSTHLILVLTPTLANPYYPELIQAIEGYAHSRDYRVVVCNTFRQPELEKHYLDIFSTSKVDGVIYTFLPSYPRIVEQMAAAIPILLIGEKRNDLSICSIELSNHTAGMLLAEHLYQLQHRHITFVSTPMNQMTLAREQRLDGLRAYFAQQGLSDCVDMIEPDTSVEADVGPGSVPYEYHIARQLTRRLLRQNTPSTALIGANDMIAIGICDELHANGLRIPDDFSVCGFDNNFASTIVTPALTTIDHHLRMRSKSAIDMIIDHSGAESAGEPVGLVNKIEYAPNLIVRSSTGPSRNKTL